MAPMTVDRVGEIVHAAGAQAAFQVSDRTADGVDLTVFVIPDVIQ